MGRDAFIRVWTKNKSFIARLPGFLRCSIPLLDTSRSWGSGCLLGCLDYSGCWLKKYKQTSKQKTNKPTNKKESTPWELWVKFYLGQNENYNPGDRTSDNSEELLQRRESKIKFTLYGKSGKIKILLCSLQSIFPHCALYIHTMHWPNIPPSSGIPTQINSNLLLALAKQFHKRCHFFSIL